MDFERFEDHNRTRLVVLRLCEGTVQKWATTEKPFTASFAIQMIKFNDYRIQNQLLKEESVKVKKAVGIPNAPPAINDANDQASTPSTQPLTDKTLDQLHVADILRQEQGTDAIQGHGNINEFQSRAHSNKPSFQITKNLVSPETLSTKGGDDTIEPPEASWAGEMEELLQDHVVTENIS